MDKLQPRVSIPRKVTRGEIVEVRTLISHPMETGYRRNRYGEKLPKHIIEHFTAHYLGKQVFSADFGPGIAANPYLSFYLRVTRSGQVKLSWVDDSNKHWESDHEITVT